MDSSDIHVTIRTLYGGSQLRTVTTELPVEKRVYCSAKPPSLSAVKGGPERQMKKWQRSKKFIKCFCVARNVVTEALRPLRSENFNAPSTASLAIAQVRKFVTEPR